MSCDEWKGYCWKTMQCFFFEHISPKTTHFAINAPSLLHTLCIMNICVRGPPFLTYTCSLTQHTTQASPSLTQLSSTPCMTSSQIKYARGTSLQLLCDFIYARSPLPHIYLVHIYSKQNFYTCISVPPVANAYDLYSSCVCSGNSLIVVQVLP